jgi:acetyl esterase/lipase/DNA-binding MarR family transcriptional regulator
VDQGAEVVSLKSAEGVDLRQLRAFVAVAEELNFGRAAQRLYVSQPALSRQIRSLERAIGCLLLVRNTHRVELTLAGHSLLEHTREVLAALDRAILTTQSVGGELNARMMAVWAPMQAVVTTIASVEKLREVFEDALAEMPVPTDLEVRPVNAGGVGSLVMGSGEPATLYLHGGGCVLGSAYGYRPVVSGFVMADGAGVLVPDYRLAPEHPYPAAIEDALAAYRWLVARAPSDVVIVADSSGCHLALNVLLTTRELGDAMPAGVVLMCPSTESPGGLLASQDGQATVDPIVLTDEAYRANLSDLTSLPPMLIQAARGDAAVEDARSLAKRAREDGVEVTIEEYPTDPHMFQMFWSFLPEAAEAMTSVRDFIQARLTSAVGDGALQFDGEVGS